MIRKNIQLLSMVVALPVALFLFISASNYSSVAKDAVSQARVITNSPSLYSTLHLKELGLNENAYNLALTGWKKLKQKGDVSKDIISICDFTQSSSNKRLYIIDLATGTLLFNTLVAHGKNTGDEFARYFSNQLSSYQSSLGFYTTKESYIGQHGMCLKLAGEEPGFNNNAEGRAIVVHGAAYVCDEFIHQYGRLGRSFGCPSVPLALHAQIINTIKNGSCLFIYYPDKNYLSSSRLIN